MPEKELRDRARQLPDGISCAPPFLGINWERRRGWKALENYA